MERRLTGFLLPVLIAVAVWLFFFADNGKKKNGSGAPGAAPAAASPQAQEAIAKQPQGKFDPDAVVSHVFGEKGREGFQVHWSLYGAAVMAVALNDHYASPAAAAKQEKEDGDYYWIVPFYNTGRERDWGYGLVLEGAGEHRFPKAIDDGPKYQRWEVAPIAPGGNEVRFTLDMGPESGLVLEKVYRWEPGRRDLQLEINLVRKAGGTASLPPAYQVRLRGVQVWNPKSEHLIGMGNPAHAVSSPGPEGAEINSVLAAKAAEAPLWDPTMGRPFRFAGTTNRFFAGFLYPDNDAGEMAVQTVTGSTWPSRGFVEGDPKLGQEILAGGVPEVRCHLQLPVPDAGKSTSLRYRLYLGPKSADAFAAPDDYARFRPFMHVEMASGCCCTIPGIPYLAKGLVWLIKGFHALLGSWGMAIIMLTLLVRILLSPVNFNMQRTMRIHGEKMQKLKPQLDKLNQRYKDDPKQLQVEMMKFNKEHKLLTAPLKGCLPMFLTMPVWFGLFTALRVMYELRGEGFFFIPDLSRPDMLFYLGWDLGLFEIPYFNILPILMVGLWIYLQMATPLPKDPQQRQMMQMMRFMPVMMGVMLYNYAAGLMVYMCTSSVWGIVEQKITKKILGPMPESAAGTPAMPML